MKTRAKDYTNSTAVQAVCGFAVSLVVCTVLGEYAFFTFAHWLLTDVLAGAAR